MSHHLFYTLHNHELTSVLMGWDKPLQGYFMIIDKPDNKTSDKPFWSNLENVEDIENSSIDDTAAKPMNKNTVNRIPTHPKTLTPFLKILEKLAIKIPAQMIQEIIADGINNIGHKYVTHSLSQGVYKRVEGEIF